VRPLTICADLDASELCALDVLAREAVFETRETLFMEDDRRTHVYNVRSGAARLYKLLPDGRRQIVAFALAGDFLGLSAGDTYGFSVDALEPLEACRFDRPALEDYITSHPAMRDKLQALALQELERAREQMLLLGRRDAEERIACFVLSLRDRFARINGAKQGVPLPMTRQDMADYLGLTIETVSRTVTRLSKERLLMVVPGGLRILDEPRLKAITA
jgi:CRP/FNR family transcriptional regulator